MRACHQIKRVKNTFTIEAEKKQMLVVITSQTENFSFSNLMIRCCGIGGKVGSVGGELEADEG